MNDESERPKVGPASPFFIVREVRRSVKFYERMNFEVRYLASEEDPIFAIVGRDHAQLFLKAIDESVLPQPNPTRHAWASWDVFVHVADPDALAAEFRGRSVSLHKALADFEEHDLRGFEVRDEDGYVLFFGRPLAE